LENSQIYEVKQHAPEQPMYQRGNIKGNIKIIFSQIEISIQHDKTYGMQQKQN
jgi:hypothetical protein